MATAHTHDNDTVSGEKRMEKTSEVLRVSSSFHTSFTTTIFLFSFFYFEYKRSFCKAFFRCFDEQGFVQVGTEQDEML